MKLLVVLLSVILAAVCSVEAVCQNATVVKDFDVEAYMGLWYEIERFPQTFEPNGSCVTATYSLMDGPEPVRVYNRLFNDALGEYDDIVGSARLADNTGDAKLLVTFPVAPFPAPYWVLDTDYTSFALVHSCSTILGVTAKSAWILSRETTLSAESIVRVNAAIVSNGVQADRFQKTRQGGDCVYV